MSHSIASVREDLSPGFLQEGIPWSTLNSVMLTYLKWLERRCDIRALLPASSFLFWLYLCWYNSLFFTTDGRDKTPQWGSFLFHHNKIVLWTHFGSDFICSKEKRREGCTEEGAGLESASPSLNALLFLGQWQYALGNKTSMRSRNQYEVFSS